MQSKSHWRAFGFALRCILFSLVFCALADAQNRVSNIVSAIQSGQFELAVEECQSALKNAPRDPRLWTLKGIAYVHLNRPEQALPAFDSALKFDPSSLAAPEGAAQVQYQQGNKRAVPLLKEILKARPDDLTTHAMLAVMQYKSKDYAGAVENFQKGNAAISNQHIALMQYGYSLSQLKRYDDAIPVFRRALELRQGNIDARYDLALDQWLANHPQDAAETLKPLLENPTANAIALRLAADIYESQGNTPKAVELLRRAMQADPKNPQNYIAFATLSFNHGSFQAGVEIIDVGLTQVPNAAELYLTRGILYGELSQFDKAMADFEHADQLDQHIRLAFTAEGLIHSQEHNLIAAIESFRVEAKLHPSDALTQYLLAEALEQRGYAEGSPEFREEIEAADRAVKLDPKMVEAQDLLSTIYLQSARVGLAIEHSRAALQQDPDDQSAVYHMILALRRTDRKDELAALIKRLAELRKQDQAEARQKNGYRLVIEAAPNQAPAGDILQR